MFQGCAYQLWADKEFPILKNLTVQPSQDTGRIDTGYNHALLETLHEALGTLPCKKSKVKAAKKTEKANATLEDLSVQKDEDPQHETTLQKDVNTEHQTTSPACPAFVATPLTRKRRNSLDSIRGFSARKSATIAELKSVVSNLEGQITEINTVLKSQSNESLLEDRISDLQDKIAQFENSSKANYQALSARVAELELQNDDLKTENNKLKSEIKNLKGKLNAVKHSVDESLSNKTQEQVDRHVPDQAEANAGITFPADVPVSNSFSVLQEDLHVANTTSSTLDERKGTPPRSGHPTTDNKTRLVRKPETESPANIAYGIILLIDSNGKYIDPDKFTSNKETRQLFCPTIPIVIKTLAESSIGQPSHIIIHVGTNDIERTSLSACQANFQHMLEIASQKYPSSKILISSLLKRADDFDVYRSDFNSKLNSLCAQFPNVHIVSNDNIPVDYLHDNKHLKRRKIGALVANLKDVVFNRTRSRQTIGPSGTHLLRAQPPTNMRVLGNHMASPSNRAFVPHPPPDHPYAQPSFQAHQSHPTQAPYSAVVKMAPPVSQAIPNTTPPQSLSINTVLELLKLYEFTRHS